MSASTCHLCECVCMGITPDDSAPCGCDCEVCDCAQRAHGYVLYKRRRQKAIVCADISWQRGALGAGRVCASRGTDNLGQIWATLLTHCPK